MLLALIKFMGERIEYVFKNEKLIRVLDSDVNSEPAELHRAL
jgi:hypothetical protein